MADGKGRGWGTSHPGYWLPLDMTRRRKNTLIVLDVGARVKPAFSPDEPAEVLRVLRARGFRVLLVTCIPERWPSAEDLFRMP